MTDSRVYLIGETRVPASVENNETLSTISMHKQRFHECMSYGLAGAIVNDASYRIYKPNDQKLRTVYYEQKVKSELANIYNMPGNGEQDLRQHNDEQWGNKTRKNARLQQVN